MMRAACKASSGDSLSSGFSAMTRLSSSLRLLIDKIIAHRSCLQQRRTRISRKGSFTIAAVTYFGTVSHVMFSRNRLSRFEKSATNRQIDQEWLGLRAESRIQKRCNFDPLSPILHRDRKAVKSLHHTPRPEQLSYEIPSQASSYMLQSRWNIPN